MQRPLADAYGRVATDLRISLTDRCTLRCTYCMPAEGARLAARADDAHRPTRSCGWSRSASTARDHRGPAHRRRAAAAPWTSSTSSADHRAALGRRARGLPHDQRPRLPALPAPLADAGLDRVNISLDTLDRRPVPRAHPPRPARRHARGHRRRRRRGLRPVKINAVAHARRQRRRGWSTCSVRRGPRLRDAVHRADAARRRPHLGPPEMVTAARSSSDLTERVHAHPELPGRGARRPSSYSSTAARRRSA